MSLLALADAAGIRSSDLARIENETRPPSEADLAAIAAALDAPPGRLVLPNDSIQMAPHYAVSSCSRVERPPASSMWVASAMEIGPALGEGEGKAGETARLRPNGLS